MPSASAPKTPEFFELEDGYARYHPVAHVSFGAAIAMVDNVIWYCVETGVCNLLLDATGLTGFTSPTLAERYHGIDNWAQLAAGKLRIAEIDRNEQLDPTETNVVIAANRGLQFRVFTDMQQAVDWLLR